MVSIDGTEISDLTIDGDAVSEVTMDGDVVWTAIPDSAIHQWAFDEGEGTTVADSIGNADGTVNGATWVSGAWFGDYALDGDGTDYILTNSLGNFGSIRHNVAISLTVQTTANNGAICGVASGNNDEFAIWLGDAYGSTAGRPSINYGSGGTESSTVRTVDADVDIDDGDKYRIGFNTYPDASDVEAFVNGVEVSTTVHNSGTDTDFADFTDDFAIFCRNDEGSISNVVDSTLDNVIIYDTQLSASEWQNDYDRQPWS